MFGLFEKSLLLRLGLAMAAITALAFLGMLSSVFISEGSQGSGSAINQAGSLRMQSYRIATILVYGEGLDSRAYWQRTNDLVNEFEQRLESPRLVNALPSRQDHAINLAYARVADQWQRVIKPVLNAYISVVAPDGHLDPLVRELKGSRLATATRSNIRSRYLKMVDDFVADIDHLVRVLEDDVEYKIRMLHLIQVITLFLTIGVVFITMHLMHTKVLVPLRELLASAEAARQGDLSVRTSHEGEDELGQLGHAFNVMAEELSKMYADLEERVREKTRDLERSNRSLELLYKTSQQLNDAPLSDETFTRLLDTIQDLIGVGPGTICLANSDGGRAIKLASTRHPPAGLPDICSPPNCADCFDSGSTHMIRIPRAGHEPLHVISIPITEQEQQYGVLLMEVPAGETLRDWQTRLLEAVAGHIGIAISFAQRASQSRRLALLEERGVIARELHDSLAQSLSYMKIQISRIKSSLNREESTEKTEGVVEELRDGINSAYRQLRELLTTFRLQMDGRGLSTALDETVREFRERSGIAIDLQNNLYSSQLSANEEIHVLQVVREALSNVVRHAEADEAHVILNSELDGRVTVLVLDNGVGIPAEAERLHHYGLAIMNERTQSLGGKIEATRRPQGGTQVKLTFHPAAHTAKEL